MLMGQPRQALSPEPHNRRRESVLLQASLKRPRTAGGWLKSRTVFFRAGRRDRRRAAPGHLLLLNDTGPSKKTLRIVPDNL